MSRPAASASKASNVYRSIRERIIDGRYTPGYRLTLSTLADEFEVSTVPVREAVRWLEAEGLVEYAHNKGAQVSAIDTEQYRESMEALAILEATVTALSAPHLSEESLEIAEAFNQRMIDLVTLTTFDSDAYRRLNGHFHSTLCSACPNRRLLTLTTTEAERVTIIRRSSLRLNPAHSAESVKQHAQLLDMIRNGAPAADIEDLVREHKFEAMRSILKNIA